jgi:hypothetical protein
MIKAGLKALEQWKDLPPGEVMTLSTGQWWR